MPTMFSATWNAPERVFAISPYDSTWPVFLLFANSGGVLTYCRVTVCQWLSVQFPGEWICRCGPVQCHPDYLTSLNLHDESFQINVFYCKNQRQTSP